MDAYLVSRCHERQGKIALVQIKQITAEATWPIRHQVMWPAEEVDYVVLDDDGQGVHFGLFVGELLVSVVSLFHMNGVGQFRKFATSDLYQGKGYGTMLLIHMIQQIKQLGVKRLWANARVEKYGFYERLGFAMTDESFIKNGQSYVIIEQYY